MKKQLEKIKQLQYRVAAGVMGAITMALVAMGAKADSTDDAIAVATSTMSQFTTSAKAVVLGILSALIGLFLFFWAFRYVWKKIRSMAH